MKRIDDYRTLHTNGAVVSYRQRRRRGPDVFERLFATVLAGALVVSLLLVVAGGFFAVWVVVAVVQDLIRRLGG